MPREIRKRGKKHKKVQHGVFPEGQGQEGEDHQPNNPGEPSWIVPACEALTEDVHPEAPFGYVDPDVKAYFRAVDEQIQSWQEDRTQPVNEDTDLDPNEGACFLSISTPNAYHCRIPKQNEYFLLQPSVRCQGKRSSLLQIQIVLLYWREWHIQWMTLCYES